MRGFRSRNRCVYGLWRRCERRHRDWTKASLHWADAQGDPGTTLGFVHSDRVPALEVHPEAVAVPEIANKARTAVPASIERLSRWMRVMRSEGTPRSSPSRFAVELLASSALQQPSRVCDRVQDLFLVVVDDLRLAGIDLAKLGTEPPRPVCGTAHSRYLLPSNL